MPDKIKYNYSGNRQGMWDREEWRRRKQQAVEKQYTRPAYGHMVRDYMDNQKRVILDKTQWLWLNFKEKKARFGRMSDGYNEPATIWEYVEFVRNFYKNGIKDITFKQLKSIVNFDGRRRKNRIYAVVLIDKMWLFLSMMNKKTINEEYAQMWRNLEIHGEYIEARAIKEYLESELSEIERKLDRIKRNMKY